MESKVEKITLNEGKTQGGQNSENTATRQLVGVLSDLYSQQISKDEFINKVKDLGYQKEIVAKFLFGKKYEELSDQEKKEFEKEMGKYEFFQIYNKDGSEMVDKNGFPILEFRKNCHGSKVFNEFEEGVENYHRASEFIIINANNEVLISLRSLTKDVYEGYWEIGGGHPLLGENFIEILIREIREEQGIQKGTYETEKLGKVTFIDKNQVGRQFQHQEIFVVYLQEGVQIKSNEREVSATEWIKIENLFDELKSRKLIPHQKFFLLKYLKKIGYDIQEYVQEVDESMKENNVELVNQEWFI